MMMVMLLLALSMLIVSRANETDFKTWYDRWYPKCVQQRVVLPKNGSDYLAINLPWSLNSSTIHDFARGNGRPYCKSVDELMESVTHPVNEYTCRVPWLSLDEVCSLIQSHSFIVWSGDSLMRHQIQALLLILKQDLMYGGFPPQSQEIEFPYDRCQCDGQFSEARICRNYTNFNYNEFFSFTDISKHTNLCAASLSGIRQAEFLAETGARFTFKKDRNYFTRPSVITASVNNSSSSSSSISNNGSSGSSSRRGSARSTSRSRFSSLLSGGSSSGSGGGDGGAFTVSRCSTDPRPVFFLLQGGAHYYTDAKDFIKNYLKPFLKNIDATAAQCKPTEYKINIVVSGVVTSSPELVLRYPKQSHERSVKFYTALEKFLRTSYPSVRLLNFLSLTSEGVNRSDGFHSFADINLIKTMIVLNAMKLMLAS